MAKRTRRTKNPIPEGVGSVKKQSCHARWIAGGIALYCLIPISPTRAQIVPDGTLPVNSIVTPGGNTTLITGGTVAGTNLFHSFEQFSIPTGSTAFFDNDSAIQNIVSRVTGGAVSNIDGALRANGTANLFLLNPNGIIFGRNATLSIGGSILASTANSVSFADGTQFSATAPQATPLLTVSVPIGLQFGGTAGPIRVHGSGNNLSVDPNTLAFIEVENPVGLQVQLDKTLALVGGDVTLDEGNLIAKQGRIEVGSVAGPGLVSLTPTDKGWTLGYENVPTYGDIQLSRRASVNASGSGGGDIQVQGRHVTLEDGSAIFALTLGSKPGGTVSVNASDSVEVIGTSADGLFPSALFTDTQGAGAGGDLTITTKQLSVRDGAEVTADTLGTGDAGSLTVNAFDSIKLIGISADSHFASGLFTVTKGAGAGGELTINTRQLLVKDGAYVSTSTYGTGKAGTLAVNALDSVELSGTTLQGRPSALFTNTQGAGAAGDLTITTNQLLVQNGARITASTSGAGDAGSLSVNASDSVELSGTAADGLYPSGLFAEVEQGATGNGRNLTIETGQLLVQNGAVVSAATSGTGAGGTLEVKASEAVELIGESAYKFPSGLFTSVQKGATGAGGNLTLETRRLIVQDGARITASTWGEGVAGTLIVKASESVKLSGTSEDGQRPSLLTAQTTNTGDAGNLRIETEQLTVRDGAKVSVSTSGSGQAGSLNVNAANTVKLDGQDSGLFARAINGGNAGSLTIATRQLTVQNGAEATVSSPLGQAGNLTVMADSILLNRGNLTAVTGKGQAEGGANITLQLRDLLQMRNESRISADALATANGGNINITTDFLIAQPPTGPSGSDIRANAIKGNGGRVNITSSGIFGIEYRPSDTALNDITASSEFGSAGVVTLNTPDVDPSQGLVFLPAELVDASGLIASGCGAPSRQLRSEFIVTGRGGLPSSPSETLSSDTVWSDLRPLTKLAHTQPSSESATQPVNPTTVVPLVEAQGWVINNKGEVVLTATAPTVTPHNPWQKPIKCDVP